MKNLKLIVSLIGILFLISACGDDDSPVTSESTGFLSLGVSLSIESEAANGRTTDGDPDEFFVAVYDVNDAIVISYPRLADAPAVIELPTGEYYVVAHSDNLEEAAFENPYYYGRSTNFTIDKEEVKEVDILAELANCKVSFQYSESVVNTFNSYTSAVTVRGSGTTLSYIQGETREGYFTLEPLDIQVDLSYTKLDGTTIDRSFSASIEDPQPKTLYKVNVDASLQDGQITFNLIVDETFVEEEINLGAAANVNTFLETYGGSLGELVYGGAIQTTDGGFIVGGSSSSSDVVPSNGDLDFYVVKTDADGIVEWQNGYGSVNQDLCWGIAQTSDGGFVAAGTQGGYGMYDGWLIKLDEFGNQVWDWVYSTGEQEEFFAVDILTNGNIAVAGSVCTYVTCEVFVAILDNNGAVLNQYNYGDPLNAQIAYDITATSDGGFVMTGVTAPYSDVLVLKADHLGNFEWSYNYGGTANDRAWEVIELGGEYYISGESQSVDGNVSAPKGGPIDGWVLHLDNAGNLIGEVSLGGSGQDILYGIGESPTGNLIVVGRTDSQDGDLMGRFGATYNLWYSELTPSLDISWTRWVSINNSIGRSINKTNDGGIIISGHTNSATDIWLIKTDNLGIYE